MEWIIGIEAPSLIEEGRKWCQPKYVLNVLSEKVADENGTEQWRWLRIDLPVGAIKYGDVVSGVIRAKYTQDEMEAITNNMAAVNAVFMQTLVSEGIIAATSYLKDSIDEEQTTNFQAMQEWRRTAKEVATEVMAYAKEKGLMTS